MKVLELFSGIGGMHLSLKESGLHAEVVASVDINQVANTIYNHNFKNTLLLNRNIQSLSSEYINSLNIDTILMSPPCQPFTRNGLKQDLNDARTLPFTHVLNVLPKIHVQNILIENVKGFETSDMRNFFVRKLEECNFTHQEFLLSPSQFGVPNQRCRYYCLAKKNPGKFLFECGPLMLNYPMPCNHVQEPYTICEILEQDLNPDQFLISETNLLKRATALDICFRNSRRSCCFTKSYGRYVTGTGSVFTEKTKEEVDFVYKKLNECRDNRDDYLKWINKLQLRFFTPREVCRLMCFPDSFRFPEGVTNRQRYMLLGNSINVKVVSELIKLFDKRS